WFSVPFPPVYSGGTGGANAPGTQQAQCRCLFAVEAGIPGADDAQMPGTEIVDGSPVEILLHDRRADVGRARNGRSVSQLLADVAHDRGDPFLRLRRILGRILGGELDRGDQRPAPRSEILRRELRAEMLLDVVVQPALVEVAAGSIGRQELEEALPRQREQLAHRCRELGIHDGAPEHDRVLAAVAECDPRAAHRDVALAERRDPECARLLGIAVAPAPDPPQLISRTAIAAT